MMVRENMILGGEQSGHIILMNHMPTGDGQLTALHFLSIVSKYGMPVSELIAEIPHYPQVLINILGPYDAQAKAELIASPNVQAAIREQEERLGGDGRILVRPSGTEALLRVMVEAPEEHLARSAAERIAEIIQNEQK